MTKPFFLLIALFILVDLNNASAQQNGQLVRIAEIEIKRDSLDAYKAILKEEAEASIRLEPGVISIFPMYQKKDSTQVRILEIYASPQAYELHLKTPHFQRYKTTTVNMVKSLQLVDMNAIDSSTMFKTFSKVNNAGKKETELVFPKGEKITNDNFKGTVYLQMLIGSDSLNANSVGNVTFEPGARTKWHLHPAGQILLVTYGVGYYQEKGQQKKVLRKGDVIKCPPDVPHWHGASVDSYFVQVAITGREKGETVWLQHVTDIEYNN